MEERTPTRITLHQPLGEDGTIAVLIPGEWSDTQTITMTAYAKNGQELATETIVPTDGLLYIPYVSTINGVHVAHYTMLPGE